ncbi:hypothetical protein DAPPUDRAFT_236935 [Daphnia pulex]|uniref:Uncharacterized protein n=1 Tax=Daphnia pulex TaxID=6669 RepID=E9G2B5_DAPPU|nr:hypothetical protein DAPPUDRAFT_236935 [Daphnia pulex]|eukprot:EFX86218.1 hypothetical protein DAPPUDRAFT_236935 [Daphnia pulex]
MFQLMQYFNLQTGRPVCMSFTLEGRVNYGVVLLLGVESLTVGSTTGAPMSPVNCGVVLLLIAVLKYYTTEASEYYTTINAAARCITKEPEYYMFTLVVIEFIFHNVQIAYPPPKCTPPMLKSYATNYAAPSYITKAPEYYITEALQLRRRSQAYNTAAAPSYYVELKNYTKSAVNYTTIYATPSYYGEAPNYYTEEATCYTSTYSAPVYYTEEPKYYSAPSYYQTEAPVCYTKATDNYGVVLQLVVLSLMAGLTTGVPMSPGYGGYQIATPASYHTTTYAAIGYYTPKALEYYTITYYVPNFYTEGSKYFTTKATEYYTTSYAATTYYIEALKFTLC